jgi:uncharacterized protein YerC
MVYVNRNQLAENELAKLLKQFDSLLAKQDRKNTELFLNELLGKEERLMLVKRFAAITLLFNGFSEYKTARTLKLSPTTTGKIAKGITDGSYISITRLLQKNKRDYLAILNTIDSILHLGGLLPHRVGLERYRNL